MDKQTFIKKAALMQPTYTPSDAVKVQLSQVDMIAVVGPTGVGKTTIMEHSGLPYVTSFVTRAPRKGEDNGVDYNFRTDYDVLFAELHAGEYVQYIIYPNGEFYGTKASAYPASGPCTMAVVASTIPLVYSLGFRNVLPVYIIPPDYNTWMKRAGSHHDNDMPARLIEAKASIEAALADSRYNFIVNDDLLTACDNFRAVAQGRVNDPSIQQQARQTALQLLTGIDSSEVIPR